MDNERQKALDLIESSPILVMVTTDKSGYPTGRRIGFVNDGFTLLVPTQRSAIKLRQLARSSRASVLFFDPATNRYLQIKTDVEIVDDHAFVDAVIDRYMEKYPQVADGMTPEARQNRIALKLVPRSLRGDGVLGPRQSLALEGEALA
jgi:general stress protein 26